MISTPVLALPDFASPFVLEIDASGTGLGAVMMQHGKPIAYYSSTLCPKNAALSTYEKEALAIIKALKRWRHYFLGNDLIIRIDHQSLQFMTDQRVATSIQHKLMLKLLEFHFVLEYKKGKENIVVDALSRKNTCMAISMATPEWISEVENSYSADPHCQKLLEQLLLSPTHSVHQNTLQDGTIRHKGKIYVGKDLPLRNRLLQALHSSAIGDTLVRKLLIRDLKMCSIGQE